LYCTKLRTTDRDLAVETARRVAAHRPRITVLDRAGVDFRLTSAGYDGLATHGVRIRGLRYGARGEPLDFLMSGTLFRGHARLAGLDREVTLADGGGFLYPVGSPYECEFLDPDLTYVALPVRCAEEVAEQATGLAGADLRFEALTPVSEPMSRFWANTAAFLHRHLSAETALPGLIAQQLVRMAASAMLSVFPNTTMTAARTPATGRTAPAAVRRAVAFVDDHADRPITAAEIAAHSGIGLRALEVAFRRHQDTTPMAYLRRVRLERAHRELQAADPAGDATVTGVARRWGFSNPGRFAATYRATYGRSPSQTLST
jgi:AraC-like DNA-binding protein